MNKTKSITIIKKFVEKEVHKNYRDYERNLKIQQIKKILEKKRNNDEKEITFTIGELNAYLG